MPSLESSENPTRPPVGCMVYGVEYGIGGMLGYIADGIEFGLWYIEYCIQRQESYKAMFYEAWNASYMVYGGL